MGERLGCQARKGHHHVREWSRLEEAPEEAPEEDIKKQGASVCESAKERGARVRWRGSRYLILEVERFESQVMKEGASDRKKGKLRGMQVPERDQQGASWIEGMEHAGSRMGIRKRGPLSMREGRVPRIARPRVG
jgi:hypothetical protein